MSGVYLAGPLDGLNYDGREWYERAAGLLQGFPAVCYCPGNAYLNTSYEQARFVERYNRAAIEASRVVLANLSSPGLALGTIREIEFANSRGKYVVVVGSMDSSLAAHDLEVVPDLEEAAHKIQPWLL
jgi:nucleoside 2-deoxyribosyltransferase